MKNTFVFFAFSVLISIATQAQQPIPKILKEPTSWSFEQFALPPSFAPNFPYKGIEELRFSPGMFSKDSNDYFTYAFAAQLDNTTTISQDDIKNYLLNYFKGLCSSTANDRKLKIDTSKITVLVERKKGVNNNEIIYNAFLNIFGVFTDGAPVKLNMEIKVMIDAEAKKTYLVFIASPHEKSGSVWKQLYQVQKKFMLPSNIN